MENQNVLFQCSGKIDNKPASVTVDHKFIKFISKKINKAIPIKQISGCNIVKGWDKLKLKFGILTCVIGLFSFSVSTLAGLALIIVGAVAIWLGKLTYVEINSSSDKINFVMDKNYNPHEFINVIQTAIYNE